MTSLINQAMAMKSTFNSIVLVVVTVVVAVAIVPATSLLAEPVVLSVATDSAESPAAAPIDDRFAAATDEVPDFQRHVVPLLGRLGCNGRACHGSFQGRGGFQLSLFGYDFKADYAALMDQATGRVDVDDVGESLILAKPIDADMHEGGKRMDRDSWQYRVVSRWIESGAADAGTQPQTLDRLQVVPAEIQLSRTGETVDVRAIAHWADGTSEDVTPLCRFSSNDDSVAAIDENGKLVAGVTGGTHVVVYYDNAVVPIPVLRPIPSSPSDSHHPVVKPRASSHPIDQLVDQKLTKLGIVASGVCTDSEFIRRASLDITGVLPTADAVRVFLADASSDKRQTLIDELIDAPAYAAWWATRLSDWTGNSEEQLVNVLPMRNVASKLWYQWLRKRIQDNVPYDELVDGIVTAQSRQPGESYAAYCEAMTKACASGNEELYAERDGLPLYWARRNFQKPEERAIGFAYTFLGVRIECAQCHKHPFDQWSKDDFEQFAKLFTPFRMNNNSVNPSDQRTRDELLKNVTGDKTLRGGDLRRAIYDAARDGQVVPFSELVVATRAVPDRVRKARKQAMAKGREMPPMNIPTGKVLGQPDALTLDQDRREDLMVWLRSPDNPYFARAIVNRVWSNYFGVGIVNPPDDLNLANPPSNAPLLDHLATTFIANGFDLRWLHRYITTSDTYQRSIESNRTNAADEINFARHVPRRLPAEVVYDSVMLATGSDRQTMSLRKELDQMAIADGGARGPNQQNFALQVFGQSIRESNCDCDRSDDPSLLQSIYLRNDIDMYRRLADKDGWVNQACESLGVSGPTGTNPNRANERAMMTRALAMQKQLIGHVQQFSNANEFRKARFRTQLKNEHERVSKKFAQFGYEVPPLAQLLKDPTSWTPLDQGPASPNSKTSAANASVTIDELIEEAYLRTLSRFPDADETAIANEYIAQSKSPADGLQSILWALVNTKEFIISH